MAKVIAVANQKGGCSKTYFTESGYMGYVEGRYVLFASEDDYKEYVEG